MRLLILALLCLIKTAVFSQDLTSGHPSINSLNSSDSIAYMVHVVTDAYSRTEILVVKKTNSQLDGSIKVESNKADYVLDTQKATLNNSQIDTLVKFEKSLYSKKIESNQGLKIAGRMVTYTILYKNEKYEFEDKNLYSLLDALEIEY